jgi:hypothetical protein
MINHKKWITTWFIIIMSIPVIGVFNYIIDPYGIYKNTYFNFPKIKQVGKMRYVRSIKIKEIKPVSICLGTSRVEYAYDPNHQYFLKPSYNLANSSSSMYENNLYFKWALKQGNLKKVLLVVDYRMFNEPNQKDIPDLETYFEDNNNIYTILFSLDTLKDSFATITEKGESFYFKNGQAKPGHKDKEILKAGGHLLAMQENEKYYYKGYPTNYTYIDTNVKSFPHFEELVKLCYENNITLDIIFGPSHIRLWEALNYYLDYNKWLEWKKDIVISVNNIANQYKQQPFRIIDFSIYHLLTAEKVPKNKKIKMKYHWESSHYKNELGLIVLDKLIGIDKYHFGVQLNINNIDKHLEELKLDNNKRD